MEERKQKKIVTEKNWRRKKKQSMNLRKIIKISTNERNKVNK